MKRLRWPWVWLGAGALLALVAFQARKTAHALGSPMVPTGWALAATLAALAAFNVRKRLSMLPLGTAAVWLKLHVVGGLLAAGLFWLHTGLLWPQGRYEQALAVLFYLVTLNGLFGYFFQKLYPPMLTATGVEVIYERIPEELARLRAQAEAIVLDCAAETETDTLSRHYVENFDWFFRRPRFFLYHACGLTRGRQWVRYQAQTVRRYLGKKETPFLDRLSRVAFYKNDIDFHYAAQGIMKGWLLVHIPLATALLVLACWHIILVYAYSL